jgi:hypothetical protein
MFEPMFSYDFSLRDRGEAVDSSQKNTKKGSSPIQFASSF